MNIMMKGFNMGEPKDLGLNVYQDETQKTAKYPSNGSLEGLMYTTLGLNGEAGEAAEVVKKIIRDDCGVISHEKKLRLARELGDVLWYTARAAHELGYSLSEIAEMNVNKLKDRAERGKIHGSGDDR